MERELLLGWKAWCDWRLWAALLSYFVFVILSVALTFGEFYLLDPKTWFCCHDYHSPEWDPICKKCGYIYCTTYR